ncbi:hypothetical protein JG687_00019279 [Phytophthora cactorum]|uniref:Uncharacterized protein n=1 Tax=Phytophthora cactorum TaxID=29920 RepID=A0A8T1TJ79_9STRA|nr:hypothetical protein JG687_00019279 [Phytophthora cactorum]
MQEAVTKQHAPPTRRFTVCTGSITSAILGRSLPACTTSPRPRSATGFASMRLLGPLNEREKRLIRSSLPITERDCLIFMESIHWPI